MFYAFPVYNLSTCVSKSIHAGALPGPAYPYFDNHRSTEIHTVSWIPGPWAVKTASVFGDSQAMILEGHDTGMMIPHLSPIMDNALLPMTLLTSSCTFPFVASSKKCRGKGFAAFFPAYAPFIFCDSEAKEKKEKPGQPKPKQPVSSDDAQYAAGLQNKVLKPGFAFGRRNKSKIGQKIQQGQRKAQDKFGPININGRGKICVPISLTVFLKLSLADLFFGWSKFLASRSLDAMWGAVFGKFAPKKALAGRIDQSAANRLAGEALERGMAGISMKTQTLTIKRIYANMAPEIAAKMVYDPLKSLAMDGKVKLPYGIFSYGLANGKGTFLWWGKIDGSPTDLQFKGLRGAVSDLLKDTCYQPAVKELIADNPNYASAPKPQPDPAEPPPLGPYDPGRDPLDEWIIDPNSNPPGNESSASPVDFWTDPSQPSATGESAEPPPLGPYDPGRDPLDEWIIDPNSNPPGSESSAPSVDFWTDPSQPGATGEEEPH